MNHRIQNTGRWLWVMIGLWLGLVPLTSMARIDIKVTQSGSQVKMTLTGSAKTGSFTGTTTIVSPPNLTPGSGLLIVGAGREALVHTSQTFQGPYSFGTDLTSMASLTTGSSIVGIYRYNTTEGPLLPKGYKSGAALSGTATYNDSSLCSLGLTAGTYTWTWGTGSKADSLVITIDPPPPSPAPTVTAVSPASGSSAGGYSARLAGTNFCGVTGITIGGVACQSFSVNSPTSASCVVPPGTIGPASVVVTTAGGSNAANTLFAYKQPPPTVTTVSPSNGPAAGGTTITITGTGFTNVTGITVGGQACASYTVVSNTSATCTTSAGTSTRASVNVTTVGGTNNGNSLYSYLPNCNGFRSSFFGDYSCIVPAGTTSLNYTVVGAHGRNGTSTSNTEKIILGGRGAKITGNLAVTPGDTLYITVAQPVPPTRVKGAGAGGGYSSISTVSSSVGPLVVAGGGGGGGGEDSVTSVAGLGGDAGISSSPIETGGGAGGAASRGGTATNGAAGGRAATGGIGGAGFASTLNGSDGSNSGQNGIRAPLTGAGGTGFGGIPAYPKIGTPPWRGGGATDPDNTLGGGGGGGGYAGGGGGGSSLIPAGGTAVLAERSETPLVSLSGDSAPALTPSTQKLSGAVGTAITPSSAPTPTGLNGSVSYAVSPALPAGLTLNTSTGVISGTPTVAQTTANFTLTGTGAISGTATSTVSLTVDNGPALTPTLGTPQPTADGYTVAISNYDAAYTWSGKTTAGSVSINSSGLVTVSGVSPGTSAEVTIFSSRNNYYNGSASVTGTASVAALLSPGTQTLSGTVGTAITSSSALSASGFSGAVTYSISPSLPAGLSLNTSTGVISGTPTTVLSTTSYTITGSGATSGSSTASVNLTVAEGAALTPTFGTPVATANGYTVSISNYDADYTWAGAATAGSVSISSGLLTVTGLTPGATATATITVTRSGYGNGSGSVTGSASPPVTTLSPTTQTVNATQGLPLTPTAVLTPSGFSVAPSFTLTPSLPAGLSLNTVTGVISGTPTATQAATAHTVTATGGTLTATSTLNLTVSALATPTLSPATQSLTGTPGTALSPSATYTGATAATFSIQPPLPDGLSMNTSTGVISGTPTGNSSAGGALASWYSNDFGTSDLKQAAVSADASLTSNSIVLTTASTDKEGAFSVLGDVGNGVNAQAYRVAFKLSISGASGATYGADGVSYSFTDSPDLSAGSLAQNAEVGVGPRLSVSFDSYGTSGAAGYRGVRVLYGVKGNDPGTTPGVDNVLAYSPNMDWVGTGKEVQVEIDRLGRLTLTLLNNPSAGTDTVIFNQLALPAEYLSADRSNWQHIFAARTVAAYSRQAIDDLTIEQSGPGAAQYTVTATNATGSGTAAVNLTLGALPGAPTGLAATIPGAGQATISFTPPTGSGFGYQYSLDGTNWLAANVVNNAFTLSGLTGQNTIRLRAINANGPGSAETILVGTPAAPTGLTATPGNGQATISFTPGADGGSPITSYEYSVNAGSSWTSTGVFTSPVTITGLTNGTAANILLRGVNALGNGTASSAVSVTPVADPPGIPGNITAVANSGAQTVVLTWAAPATGGSAITGYTVEMTTTPPSGYVVPTGCASIGGSTLTCTATGLAPGTYFFRVLASNSAGSGEYGYTADGANIANIRPQAPTSLLATPASKQASIAFVAPTQTFNGDPISTYPVLGYEYKIGAGAWISSGSTTSPVIIEGLTNGTAYTIYLRAINAAGAGTSSASVSVTPATTPSAPAITGATASRSPLGQISIAFTAGATGGSALTNYQYSINGGSWISRSPSSTSSPLTITGLAKGVNAVIALRAVNGVGPGPADTASVTPLGVPDAPTDTAATATSTQASVSWTPPVNTGGGKIIDYTVTSSPGSRTCTTSSTGCTVTGLTNGTAYTFTVTARNSYGSSVASVASAAVRPGAIPSAPQTVTATAGNAQATVQWQAPSANTPATSSYTVVADQDASKTCTTSGVSCIVSGLTNGTAYSFSVTATNSLGTGPAGSTSGNVTPQTVPGAPLAVSAQAGNASAIISWSAPDTNGGSPITGYAVTGTPGGSCSPTGTANSCTVTGLTNGTTYSFTVTATNAVGTGGASASASATPLAPALTPTTQSVSGTVNTAISATAVLTPNTSFGGSVTYTVLPSLTAGLSLDSTTGVISGTPTAAQTTTTYVITGTSGSNTATTSVTIDVSLAKQAVLTASSAASSIAVNGTTTLSASGGSSNGAVSYAVVSGPCQVSNTNTLTGTAQGTCSVTATMAGNSTYESVTSTPISIQVTLNTQAALVASANPSTLNVNATSVLSVTGGNGSGAVIYEVASGPCGIVGTTLTGTGAGSCSVTATKAADSTYAAVTSSPISVTVQLNPQAPLVATSTAVNVNVNGTSLLNTSGGSGSGEISYAVSAGDPCSVNGNILTGNSDGTCTVTATKAADTAYAAVTSNALTITVNRNDQTLLVASANPTSINVNGTSNLATTGGSGTGAVTFNHVSGPCTVSGNGLTGTGAGTCLFTATKAEDSQYNAATSAPASVIVGLSPQSKLTVLAAPTTLNTGGTTQLSTTGGDGTGAVNYEVLNGACTISGNTLTSSVSGSCAVIATKAADSLYAAGVSSPLTVTVGLSPQSALTAVASPSTIAVNALSTLSTTGGSGQGDVFYSLVSGPCQLELNNLTGTGAGSCVVTATKTRDESYSEVTSSPITVTVGLAPQSALSVVADPTTLKVGDSSTLDAAGGSGNGEVSYTLVDGPCSLSGNAVTGKQPGTCQITATKAADTTYAEATSSPLALTVGLAPQSPLSLLGNPSSINVGSSSNLSSTGGSGTGNVIYNLVSGPCSLSGAVLSGVSVGSCVVTATKEADDRYASANASPLTVTVGLAPQSALTGLADPSSLEIYGTATLSATGGSGTGTLSFSLVSGPCSISGSTLAGLSEGSCTITATKAEDASYAAASSLPFTVAVGLVPQSTLSLLASPSSLVVDGTSDLSVTGGSGSGSVSYNLVSGPCSLSGSTLTGLDAGSCLVTATQAASGGYAAATSDPVTVTVGLAPQSPLTLNLAPVIQSSLMARLVDALADSSALTINVNESAVILAAGGSGTGEVTFQLISGPCAVSGNTLTGLDKGTCSVVATKAADAQYAEQISAPMLIIVGLTAQSPLVVSASPSMIDLAGVSSLSTSGGSGDGSVAYSVVSGPCSLAGNSVSGIGAGSCLITATKAASGSYAATTSAPLTITVGLMAQASLTLTADPATIAVGETSELNVSGGGGVGYVTYNVLNGPCAVSGSLLVGVEPGSCSISATKSSDGVYASATADTIAVQVEAALVPLLNPASQTLSGTAGTPISPSTTLAATGFVGAVSYGIAPPLPAGLSLNTSTGVISGTPAVAQELTSYVITGTGATSGSATAAVSISISASPNAIPTLSEWAQMGMMLCLLAVAGWFGRRITPG